MKASSSQAPQAVSNKKQPPFYPRRLARLLAVQALYQADQRKCDLESVKKEFCLHRLTSFLEDGAGQTIHLENSVDLSYFSLILDGIAQDQQAIDLLIASMLTTGWSLQRIDPVSRSLLRSGAYEIKHCRDLSRAVIVSEYINIAHAFFSSEKELAFVHGVLHGLQPQDCLYVKGVW